MEDNNLEAILGPDTCRLCLKVGRSPTPVSNEKLEGSTMAIKIDILTSVKVAPSDKVCPMCRINVRNFYDFRIMCLQSDARIKSWLARGEQANLFSFPQKPDPAIRIYKRVRRPVAAPSIKPLSESSIFSRLDGQGDIGSAKERRLNQMVCVRPDSRKDDTKIEINLEKDQPEECQIESNLREDSELEMDAMDIELTDPESSQSNNEACIDKVIKEEREPLQIKKEVEDFDMPSEVDCNVDILDTKDVKSEILDGNELTEEEPKGGLKEDQNKEGRPKEVVESNMPSIQIVKTETLLSAEYEEDVEESEAEFCKEPDFQEVKEEPVDIDDSENLEVLVDPLMVVDEHGDNENQPKRHEISLSPVLGEPGEANKVNGQVLYPALNGALSDEQRALDFVRKHLRKDRTPALPAAEPANSPPQLVDPLDKPFKCTTCSWSFAYYKSFVKHRNRHSGFDTPYECPHCPESFSTNKEIHVHFRKHAETQYCCEQCYRSFPSQERLDAHNFLHTGNKPHMCELCNKTFPYRSSYAVHMRKAHGQDAVPDGTFLRCHKCPTEWRSTAELKEHILEIHENEETDPGTTCEVCAMKFLSRAILNVHSRIHQGIRPFK